jgi:uncharacterized protein YjbI with pentapeptide repeats
MANPEHLDIMMKGVKTWNEWRDNHPKIAPDLIFADLILNNLRDANLKDVNLRNANLEGASLNYANLTYADLRNANLINADLESANLICVDFNYTKLNCTKFNGAILGRTTFANTDLRGAIGLEAVNHHFPSEVGVSTIYLSNGQIPEVFLRGCGLSDTLIEYIPSLLNDPLLFYSCFISYSSLNHACAERLYADLQNRGVRCWFAPEDLKIGDKIRDRIDETIRLRDKLLLILSEQSIASEWVEHEVESALEEERQRGRTILFPVRIDDAVMESKKAWTALIRRTRHIGDFTRWKEHDQYQKAFERLLRDLKASE